MTLYSKTGTHIHIRKNEVTLTNGKQFNTKAASANSVEKADQQPFVSITETLRRKKSNLTGEHSQIDDGS